MYMLPSPKYKYARSCSVRGKEVSLYSTVNNLQINIIANVDYWLRNESKPGPHHTTCFEFKYCTTVRCICSPLPNINMQDLVQ